VPSPKKPWWRRWFGTRSERAAGRYLKKCGCKILARNFSCSLGELDLVALDGEVIVFVEVRSTEDGNIERPLASVDFAKQHHLTRAAQYFLQKKRLLNHSARFDVVALRWPDGASDPEITHIRNAFEATV
jgi:putative endonuclease